MNNELIELARRAVACKGWRWMEGMSVGTFGARGGKSHFSRVQRVRNDGFVWCLNERHGFVPLTYVGGEEPLPDLSDPATLGCLLALVRDVWGDHHLSAIVSPGTAEWGIWGLDRGLHPTEAHALVAALESAPNSA